MGHITCVSGITLHALGKDSCTSVQRAERIYAYHHCMQYTNIADCTAGQFPDQPVQYTT